MLEFLKMAEKGSIYLFGDGENEINPVHGSDLAEICVDAVYERVNEINIGGHDVYTYREIAEMAFDVLDKPAKISSIPHWLNRIILSLARTFTSSKTYGPLEFMMSVMTMDVLGELYGKYNLREFFHEKAISL
jgi:nucleoside-diphosphate-sugar epimerase